MMTKKFLLSSVVHQLALAWLVCGIIATAAGFFGLFFKPLALLLLIPITYLGIVTFTLCKSFPNLESPEKIIICLLIVWWLLHSVQIFTPETGFDAVWYHLPLAQQTVSNHRFIGDINFYQSFNPQFSDSIFYLGFAAAGETGAKIVAYFFGISLILTTYQLSKTLLNRTWSLLVILLVSGFQVISWQSSSFYVDIAKAYWELSALVLILQTQPRLMTAALSLSASLASKLFSILLLPVIILILLIKKEKHRIALFFITSLLFAVPFYFFAYYVSGDAFYSFTHHLGILDSIGNEDSAFKYIFQKIISLPTALLQLIISKEYTTPLIILLFPLAIKYWSQLYKNPTLFSLTVFSMYQLFLWWFIPPTSVRYALSGFITATIVTLTLLTLFSQEKKWSSKQIIAVIILFGVLFMPLRIAVVVRSAQYLLNFQTKQQYLQQFLDGTIDTPLKKWHKDVFFDN